MRTAFPLYFANNAIVSLMGFDSYEELEQAIQGKVINTIHPDDREAVAGYRPGILSGTGIYHHLPDAEDGSWFWTLDKGQVIGRKTEGSPLSARTDISINGCQRQLAQETPCFCVRIGTEFPV